MLRRQILPAILMMVVFTVVLGFVYPLAVTAIAQVGFKSRANDSLVKHDGKVVGSSLLGQNFLDKDGNPIRKYLQPRPSAAGTGYDAAVSSASNLGPSNANLIGNVPGVNMTDKTNPYATPDDPYCVPVQATDKGGNPVTDKSGNAVYEKNDDGTYACNPNTVPERAMAYRQLNGLAKDAQVPVDAVTSSGSGLDPEISIANADLQVARIAAARHLPVSRVQAVVDANVQQRQLGFLGEKGVNVLNVNLALDGLHG